MVGQEVQFSKKCTCGVWMSRDSSDPCASYTGSVILHCCLVAFNFSEVIMHSVLQFGNAADLDHLVQTCLFLSRIVLALLSTSLSVCCVQDPSLGYTHMLE